MTIHHLSDQNRTKTSTRRIHIKINDDERDDHEFSMSPLYCSDLNDCVDAILENKDNFHDQISKLKDRLHVPLKDVQLHIVRHKVHNKKTTKHLQNN